MTKNQIDFNKWSSDWDKLYDACLVGKISWDVLHLHERQYKREWNRQK